MPSDPDQPPGWETTLLARRAAGGDRDSLGALVARLSPLVRAAAEYRLARTGQMPLDAEDLVNDAWLVALPKLGSLRERDGRITPVLLKFLTTTINYRINNLLRRRVSGQPAPIESQTAAPVPSDASGAITQAVRHETREIVRRTLDELGDSDREIILLRGIEQNASKTVATLLGLTPAAVDKRYSRALQRLRERLPDSVFAELD